MFKTVVAGFLLLGAASSTAPPCQNDVQNQAAANRGFSSEQGRSAAWHYTQLQKLNAAISALKPQRPGVVDAYVIVIGLDADPVFGREAAEAARVLSRRYDAVGRTVLLAAGTGAANPQVPNGSPQHLATSLAAIATRMDVNEDALILYATSHGGPGIGMVYRDGDSGYGLLSPDRMATLLRELNISRRMILISACYSGEFVTPLASDQSAIITASDDDRTSFGCAPGNDWTFFGDALINQALRGGDTIETAANKAFALIGEWEFAKGLTPSKPRMFIGSGAKSWLSALEKRQPAGATARVGKPAFEP